MSERVTGSPLLSLCMIVRDSARTLGPCLASIRPFVDEMILVDTGSIDETRSIAQGFGAKVVNFPWCDDFSAARNESLRLACGPWLFWMDADDTIPARCGAQLRSLVCGPHGKNTLGYVVQVHCPGPAGIEAGEMTVVDHVKLIRNHPQIRFEGRIHEQIIPSIRRLGGDVRWTDLYVVHSGFDHSPQSKERKIERDLRILQLDLAERPNHPFVLFNLGMTFNDIGQHSEAIRWLERCLSASQPIESHVRKAYALLVGSLTANDQLEEASTKCQEGLDHYPQDAELLFRQGIVFHKLGRLDAAVDSYRRALREREERHFTSIDPSIAGYKARHNLALVYADLGRQDYAEVQWRLIIEAMPHYRAAWSSLGSSLLQQKKFTTLEQILEHLDDLGGFQRERRLLEVELALARQEYATARRRLDALAGDSDEDNQVHRLRCHYLFERGTLVEAEGALQELLSRQPDCPMTLHNLGIVYFRQQKLPQAAVVLRRSLALRPNAPQTRDHLRLVEETLGAFG